MKDTIRKAMRKNERELLARIRKLNKQGQGYHPGDLGVPTATTYHTLERLEQSGRVRFLRLRNYGRILKSGYWEECRDRSARMSIGVSFLTA